VNRKHAILLLENGVSFEGRSWGAEGEVFGEVVFNTSMSGYQEIYTDPSYRGQIVTLTYPLIGNYGVNLEDIESAHPQVAGVVVREYTQEYSNFRSSKSLSHWLGEAGIIGIDGIDTRMLTRMIRTEGAMRGVLSTLKSNEEELRQRVLASPAMSGLDLATGVSVSEPYDWAEVDQTPFALVPLGPGADRTYSVVAYDFGIKRNILRRLAAYGCRITVVPATFPAEEVLRLDPDGIFLSNGPGDPAAVREAIRSIAALLGRRPIFGICLGHQLLAHAFGGKTFKLKFGHRGGNHPVKNHLSKKIEITSQNHGFAVDPSSLDPSQLEITHTNLYDLTNEGFRHRSLPIFAVQYHPEASPGPHDSDYLFLQFLTMMRTGEPVSADDATA